jgi:hypothetical protein
MEETFGRHLDLGKETLNLQDLQHRFALHEQITRLVCVEGWSGDRMVGTDSFRRSPSGLPSACHCKLGAPGLLNELGRHGQS